jgi:group I intron endonuclease
MSSGIYCIVNTENSKIYVGSSIRLNLRKRQHWCRLRKGKHYNKHLQFAWNKYGEEVFEFRIQEICEESKLLEREDYWIEHYGSLNKTLGYNIDKANRHEFSKEHCHNISIAKKGVASKLKGKKSLWHPTKEQRLKISEALKGRKHSKESIEKTRLFHLGRQRNEETKNKMKIAWLDRKNKGKFGYTIGRKNT